MKMAWLLLLWFVSPAIGEDRIPVDVVQVDCGNSQRHFGILRMPAAKPPYYDINHGDMVANALEDELQVLGEKTPVYAIQVKYRRWDGLSSFRVGLADSLEYAPKVVTASVSGEDPDRAEFEIVKQGCKKDILFIFPAGNNGSPSETAFPAGYASRLNCVLAVSTLHKGVPAHYAQRGEVWLEEEFAKDGGGTSGSAARFGAIAIHYRRLYPNLKAEQVKQILVERYKRPR